MIEIDIPGFRKLRLQHLVLDYNGTLAVDGQLLPGVAARLETLAGQLQVHVLTADTFGQVREQLAGLPLTLAVVAGEHQCEAKLDYVSALGAEQVVALGNGRIDRLMLDTAALGIAVLLAEGVATQAVSSADLLCRDILDALDLLLQPKRLIATLRA